MTQSESKGDSAGDDGAYRTLFLCTLQQETAFSFGGSDDASLTDLGLARDGKRRRIFFRGSSLAGALLATAKSFLDVPQEISRDAGAADELAQPSSIWRFDHAHPWGENGPLEAIDTLAEAYAHNAHRQDTRAGNTGGYFDLEALPRGLNWRFLLDVVHPPGKPDLGRKAAVQAALALREWARRRCWLGRRVARGLGWMRLTDCHVVELPRSEAAVDAWPTSGATDLAARLAIVGALAGKIAGAVCFDAADALETYLKGNELYAGPYQVRRAWVRWPLQIAVGEYHAASVDGKIDSYGLDALSFQGHGSSVLDATAVECRWTRAGEQAWAPFAARLAPDAPLAMTKNFGAAAPEPLLPASGIIGALRHELARDLRAAGHAVLDPVTGQRYGKRAAGTSPSAKAAGDLATNPSGADVESAAPPAPDPATELFGGLGPGLHPSRLLASDAHLAPNARSEWQIVLLEKVAIDEFRQSAYSSAKFNRLAILRGTWNFEIVQEIRLPAVREGEKPDDAKWFEYIAQCIAPMNELLDAAEKRRIGFGGGEFHGYGHVPIVRRDAAQWASAGEEWQPWRADGPAGDGQEEDT